ncbi:energy transducer TonB [Flavihumibacter sp. R14]|nr:energy transducer TonB [Flavihumibacter soli]
MENSLTPQPDEIRDQEPVKRDRSLLYMGLILGFVLLIMGYLTFFVDDLNSLFSGEQPPVTVVDDKSDLLDKNADMTDEQVRSSLVKFIEAFYYDQRKGYFDPPSYFASITETYYNYHNLTYQRLREIHDLRSREMQNLDQNWIVSSLDYERAGDNLVVTYWNKVSYFKPDWGKQESADVKNEMIINPEGKIISLRELEQKNFSSYTVVPTEDTAWEDTGYDGPGAEPVAESGTVNTEAIYEGKLFDLGTVQVAPEYPGGQKAFGKFLGSNIKYPVNARENNIQGKVYIGFIVEKTGELSDLKIIKGIGGGCDEEALRVLKTSPPWKPGMVEGKPVRTAYTFPVTFQIAN